MQVSDSNQTQSERIEKTSPTQMSADDLPLHPLLFTPFFKRTCWGGSRLGKVLNKAIGAEGDYAESWELADLTEQQSTVALGPHSGCSLAQLRKRYKDQILGTNSPFTSLPLLIKFLDIEDKLSIQVHPDDHLALQLTGGIGKTETWIILQAEPESVLYAGLKDGIDRSQFEAALENGTVEQCLHTFAVKAGDTVHLPAGTVHAIKGSVLLAEVQQASDLSYRFHDWNRHKTGNPKRELHVEQGLLCTNFDQGPVQVLDSQLLSDLPHREEVVIDCPHYTIHRHTATTAFDVDQENRFRVLIMLDGTGELKTADFNEKMEPGQTWLIPACCHHVTIEPTSESTTLLDVFVK